MNPTKKISLCAAVYFLTSLFAYSKNELIQIKTFGKNPGNLNSYIYLSAENNETKKPLVIALHGCSQNAKSFNEQSGWSNLAASHQFHVLFPEQKFINNPNSCFNWFYQQDTKYDFGESFSIYEMIVYAIKEYNIDEKKIFITGLSAGAAMSVAMMANYPNLFNAGAIFAGGPYYGESFSPIEALQIMKKPLVFSSEKWKEKFPEKSLNDSIEFPKLIIVHGTKDKIVDYSNAFSLINQWCAVLEIDTIVDNTIENFTENKLINRTSYQKSNIEKIVLFTVSGMGHALPVDPGKNPNQGGKKGVFAKDIDFYSIYYVAKEFGLIRY